VGPLSILIYVPQSETCGFQIPEIGLQLEAGTLGGRFTTLEGILTQVYDELSGKVFLGDSSEPSASHLVSGESDAQVAARERGTFSSFLGNLKTVCF
jgi:C4-type Zn-finger protein